MGGIYEVRHCDGLRCHNTHTKFYKGGFKYSNIVRGDTQTHREQGDFISLILFFLNKENRLETK
jgi:hypothetical protein